MVNKILVSLPGIEKKMHLNINILTKERIPDLDIFFSLFYHKFQKITKLVFNCSS